jgi:spore germination protein KB
MFNDEIISLIWEFFMKTEKISGLQLFYVMVGYELGTAMILGLGGTAKNDAWLVIAGSMICSLTLMWVFTKLAIYYPDDTLIQMLPKIIGKYLSYPIIILYILHFTYSASRACRELGDLILATILPETPILVVMGIFMVLMVYCLRGGVETFGRMGEMVFPLYILSLAIIWILLFTVKEFSVLNLTPVLGNGVKPVLKEVFPNGINFPFGETIIITMFFPYLNNKKNIRKIGLLVIIVGGILLMINSIMMISTIGPELYVRNNFQLLISTQMVSIADFLERFDAIVILMMVAGVFFKVGGWFFGAALAVSQLFNLKDMKSVLVALSTIIVPLSLLSANNYMEHLELGFTFFVPYVHTGLQIIIPALLLCIAFIRHKFSHK